MGPWTGFRVVLHSENGLAAMGNRRHGAVVQVEVGDVDRGWIQRVGGEGKTVVLTGDLNLPSGAAGVIQTAVAIGQLERLAAKR